MPFFEKLILQEVTKPKPPFFTSVYNECTGRLGHFPTKCIITSTFFLVRVRYIFFALFFNQYKPYLAIFYLHKGVDYPYNYFKLNLKNIASHSS